MRLNQANRCGPARAIGLGLWFALMPTIGPFLAVLLLIGQPFPLRRSDAIWGLVALAIGLPGVINSGFSGLLSGAGPILAAWLVYRAFSQLPATQDSRLYRFLSIGLLVGLAATVFLGWLQNANLSFEYRTVAQAITWETNPALYGHTVLILGAVISLLVPFVRIRIIALAVAAFGVLVSGSREAGLAWLIFALLMPLVDTSMRQARRIPRYYMFISALLLVLAGLGTLLGWGRTGFLVDVIQLPTSERNLIQSSEFPDTEVWYSYGVSITTDELKLPDQTLTSMTVIKDDADGWVRLQQVVDLEAGTPYTASAWMRSDDKDVRYGIQAWAELRDDTTFSAVATKRENAWTASATAPARIIQFGTAETFGDWQRNWFSFVFESEQSPVQMFIGLAPDNRMVTGTSAQFAGFQVERGESPTAYVPGSATRGIGLGSGRLPFWSAAWQGFTESPLIGNPESFPFYYASQSGQRVRIQEPPAHAHNQYLNVLYEGGLLGFIGLLLFILTLAWPAINRRDLPVLLLLGVVLLANFFDTTLFYGGVLYPLAAVLGWRTTTLEYQTEREQQRVARFLNSAGLVLASLSAPLLSAGAVALAAGLSNHASTGAFTVPTFVSRPEFYYACLLWPAFAWREGLFPGYGISAPQQLRRQVTASVLAALVFAVVASQFPVSFEITFLQILAISLLAVLSMPVLHALIRRLLLSTGIWGEEVVILGAGQGGSRTTQALVSNRLNGLNPIAIFDDNTRKHGTSIAGIPVIGSLDAAAPYAHARGINHAIVAIPTMRTDLIGRFMDVTGRRFKRVQFIPDLPGLPAEDVNASNLDGMLAIEINNGLFSVPNQVGKRFIDLVGASVASVLLAIPLAVIYILIRRGSPGGAFYKGERIGKDGKPFQCLKFRTMYADADERLVQMMVEDEAIRDEYERYHKLDNDPRITPIGAFLRKYSLDELPQLFNVLKGEMSLVGARPYLVRERPVMGAYADIILQAKPGMTGLWQVSGRNELSFAERLELESHYVRNWTIWWDIIIMAQTVEALASRRGAK